MKKIFIAVLVVAGLAACSQDQLVEAPKGAAIAFDNAFVENSTRANDLTAANISDFGVYGFLSNAAGNGQIFDNQAVTKSGDAFTYSPAQYWVANADYYFAAIAPYANANWTYTAAKETPDAGVLSFNNQAAAANQDLLFDYVKRDAMAEITAAPAPVALTFDHMLSRVKFSFVNGFAAGQNITLEVTNVNVTNAIAEGTIALEAGVVADEWVVAATPATFNIPFGNAGATLAAAAKGTTEHFYLIPAEATYDVTFDVTLYQAGVQIDTYNRNAQVTVDLNRGLSYELTATLNASNVSDEGNNALYPIEFVVSTVNEWVDAPAVSAPLAGDITGQTLLTDATAANLVLAGAFDGAGHTLTADVAATWTANGYLPFITTNGASKISNLTIDGQNHKVGEYGIRGVYFNGNLTLDNVTIKNVTYTMNDNSAAKTLTVVNSTLEGWTSYNPATEALFENVAFVSGGTYNTVRPHGTTTFKNCSFDNTTIDLSKLQGEVKFVGCTYNGQPLVYANLSDAAGKSVSVDYVVTSAPANNGLVSNTEVVENMTIDGGNYDTTDGKGLRGIYITAGGNYTVNNVIVRNVTYAINVNTTAPVTLAVSNSTLEGWTSYGDSTTASFDNVKFECGKYANLKPYTSTTLTDCSFEAGFMIDFTQISEGEKLTFVNCTYNGTVLTAENFAHVAKIDGDCTGKIAF